MVPLLIPDICRDAPWMVAEDPGSRSVHMTGPDSSPVKEVTPELNCMAANPNEVARPSTVAIMASSSMTTPAGRRAFCGQGYRRLLRRRSGSCRGYGASTPGMSATTQVLRPKSAPQWKYVHTGGTSSAPPAGGAGMTGFSSRSMMGSATDQKISPIPCPQANNIEYQAKPDRAVVWRRARRGELGPNLSKAAQIHTIKAQPGEQQ